MINKEIKVAVTSRSFSKNNVLRKEILQRYENVKFNDKGLKLQGASLIDFLQGCQKAITALEVIDDSLLRKLPKLEVISKYGVGLDMIDMQAIKKYNIRLGWTGGVNRRSVSELVISLSISLLRYVAKSNREVLSGVWRQHIGGHLSGRTIGIIGCGYIGQDLIRILQPFGCQILVNDIKDHKDFYKKYNIQKVEKDELLSRSDVVTLHTPLDKSTRNMLSAERLSLMKADAILINTARGGLVDENALKEMLITGRLHGAAFDVFSIEPPKDNELLNLPNFIATPHIGGSANEAIMAMGRAAINGLN